MLVAGHNHRPMFPEIGEPLYFNDGSCVHPFFITGIEIDRGKISLINGASRSGRTAFFISARIISPARRDWRVLSGEADLRIVLI
jgi:hypothetical protein